MLETFTKLKWVSHRPYRHDEAKRWFVVSLALVAMIYTGSKAMQYMPIPLFTIFKNLTIIMIAYGERTWFGGSPVTGLMLTAFLMMVLSSVIAGWADIYGKSSSTSSSASTSSASSSPTFLSSLISYFWMMLNCLTTAFYALGMRGKIKEVGFKDFDTVFYNNLLSIPVLLIASLLTEIGEWSRLRSKYADPALVGEAQALFIAILVSSVSTFAISYGSSWCVRVTSSTTYSMVGALNKLPIAVAGMMLFDDPVTVGGVMGVVIGKKTGLEYGNGGGERNDEGSNNCRRKSLNTLITYTIAFAAGIVYSYAKNKQTAEKNMSLPVVSADIKMNPLEYKTPLIPASGRNGGGVGIMDASDEMDDGVHARHPSKGN